MKKAPTILQKEWSGLFSFKHPKVGRRVFIQKQIGHAACDFAIETGMADLFWGR